MSHSVIILPVTDLHKDIVKTIGGFADATAGRTAIQLELKRSLRGPVVLKSERRGAVVGAGAVDADLARFAGRGTGLNYASILMQRVAFGDGGVGVEWSWDCLRTVVSINVVTGSSLMVHARPANLSEAPVTTFFETTVIVWLFWMVCYSIKNREDSQNQVFIPSSGTQLQEKGNRLGLGERISTMSTNEPGCAA
ncbi:hypothetical protein CROQUDRAFT_90708 [Cronartium quercuum f. sp. fusiforme G11]|uniref:Uncharacterized protein n=1 Tax=Cronartium quercuum f. sp. fusiforme G11 TaxID=708437 RepID=A0A9P6NLE6_9BASI|nr:hypothetical protein CROQUDRAFT_90708 [Cronartium quercuum f. sp. fusiforme G11]